MSYTVIQGTFRVVGFSPDGDSVRFAPNDPDLVNHLPGGRRTLAPGKSVQLRLECIDALETHYGNGSTRFTQQPPVPAKAARARLLELLGFTGVKWDANEKDVVACDKDDRPGFILSNGFDSYGARPVSYAFAGPLPTGLADGADKFLDATFLKQSANYAMVLEGHAYPMYYEGAFHDLRAEMDAAMASAAAASLGVWATDATLAGFAVPPDTALTDKHALWPKLFRRTSSFFKDEPKAKDLSGFPAWLEANRDPCFDLDLRSWSALHNYVAWDGATLRMTKSFSRLLFKG